MLLVSVGLVATMPFAVPLRVEGLSASARVIAKSLLSVVLRPLVIGIVILPRAPAFAPRAQAIVKKITDVDTVILLGLCLVICGKAFIGSAVSYATLTQVVF
jgi:predicted Na+-dependent transporter